MHSRLVTIFGAMSILAMLLIPASASGQTTTVQVDVLLVGSSLQEPEDTVCDAKKAIGERVVRIGESSEPLENGKLVTTTDSPTGRNGCLFTLDIQISARDTYPVSVGDVEVGTISPEDLRGLDNHLEIAIRSSNLIVDSIDWRFVDLTPTPAPTTAPRPTLTPTPPVPTPVSGKIEGSDGYILVGTLRLLNDTGNNYQLSGPRVGAECVGNGGYSDIKVGTQMVIKDQSGDIVAVANLESDPNAPVGTCQFLFKAEVPDATFYSISSGRRGDLVFSKSELEESDWRVFLSLG